MRNQQCISHDLLIHKKTYLTRLTLNQLIFKHIQVDNLFITQITDTIHTQSQITFVGICVIHISTLLIENSIIY